MKFKDWIKEMDGEYMEAVREKFKGKTILPANTFEWHREAYFTYKITESNRSLVWATWILAISTVILSVLTLLIK